MKKLFTGMIATLACVSLVACGNGGNEAKNETNDSSNGGTVAEQPATSNEEKVLYSNGGAVEFFETPWLNPGLFMYNKVLYEHLIEADENLNPVEGGLASDYSLSEDGTQLTFVLRDNIYWHDGEKITPEDIKWSIEYSMRTAVLNPVFTSTFHAILGADAYLAGDTEELEGIVIDGNNVMITFEKVAPDALLTFTQFAPLPQKYFTDVDPLQIQQAKFFQNPIGSGQYKLEEVKMNDYTVLVPFDQYYDGVANFKIHLTPSGESDSNFVNNAKAGLLDYGYTKNVDDVKALQGVEGLTINQVDVRYTRLLYVNKFNKKDGSVSPLADARIRQAIRYGIDMQAICDNLFNGSAVPANSLTPNGSSKVSGLNDYEYNPEKAKELLAEANWDPNYVLDVVYYYTDQLTVDLMTTIQAYLSQIGIQMNFRLVEGDLATILWSAPEDQVNGPSAVDWDMAYGANAALSMHEYYDRYRTGSASNSHTPSDETLNTLIDATNSSMDAKVQQDAFYELQKYENETLFTMALYYQPVFLVQSQKIVKGADAIGNPQYNYNWEIQNWELAE